MINCFEKYLLLTLLCCQTTPILKTRVQFENLVFVIMSTRENTRLIARTSFCDDEQFREHTLARLALVCVDTQ